MPEHLADLVRGMPGLHYWLSVTFFGVVAAAGFAGTFRNLQRARVLEDVPTSRVRSATQGYVELQGTARLLDGPGIVAPLTRTPCTWWHCTVEQRVTRGARESWSRVSDRSSEALFALEDDTGQCIVDPDGAEVYPMITERWYGDGPQPTGATNRARRRFQRGPYRFTERRIHGGDPLYAIGFFHTHRGAGGTPDLDAETLELLRAWKRDPATLVQRFDRDGDGVIDLDEWEAARAAARAQIEAEHREMAARPGLHVLRAPGDGRAFLLGALPQPHLARRLRRRAAAGLASFALGGLVLALLLGARVG